MKKFSHDPYINELLAHMPDNYISVLSERTSISEETITKAFNDVVLLSDNKLLHKEVQSLWYETRYQTTPELSKRILAEYQQY